MTTTTTEIQSQVANLATEAFEAFCSDIMGMFGLKVECKQRDISSMAVESLKERFRIPAAASTVKSDGALQGIFGMVVGKQGLFTLAGAVTMPEQMTSLLEKCVGPQKVMDNINKGTIKEAEQVRDAISEACNLMVGSWDRICRERVKSHGHFLQTETFIGEPWDNLKQTTGLGEDEEFICAIYEMKVGNYPAFDCAVVFPDAMLANTNLTLLEEGHEEEAEEKGQAADNEQDSTETADEEVAESSESPSEPSEQDASEDEQPDQEQKGQAEEEKAEQATEAKQEIEDPDTDIAEDDNTEQEVNEIEAEEEPVPQFKPRNRISGKFSLKANAEDIMDTDVFWCSPEDSVELALNKMRRHNIGYLMIGTDGVLEGIVSNSDISGAVSPYLRPIFAKWSRPLDSASLNIRLKWIMTRPVQTVRPEASLVTITENMCRFGKRCLPVVDQEGKVEGLITVFDIFKVLQNTDPNISTVGKTLQAPPLVKLDS